MKIIFRNATIVSIEGVRKGDLFLDDGKIAIPFSESEAGRIVEATGKFLLPGLIDSHVHFREPGESHKEDWQTGSLAAAMGGITTVLDMPNNNPPIISVEALESKRKLIRDKSLVNFGLFFGADGENFDAVANVNNVVGIKVYMGSSTGGLLVDNLSSLEKIFRIAKSKNLVVVIHAENEAMIKLGRRDCECAGIAVKDAISVQKIVGNKLHIAHVSCAKELQIIRENKNQMITCEVCPHHLYFSDEDVVDGFLRVNPPLRKRTDLIALWEALRDRTVDILATDHAPHTMDEKKSVNPPAGVPGIQFLLPLMLNEVNQNMISMQRLVELCCNNPAKLFGFRSKGSLEIGCDADVVLCDMNIEKKINREMVVSKCGWSPYEGYVLKGWPVMTIVGGKIVWEEI